MKTICLFVGVAMAGFAQAPNPDVTTISGAELALYKQVSGVVIRAAEKMPEESYGFKPSHDVRSFGELIGHIADAQYSFCSAVVGDGAKAPGAEKR